MAVKQHQRRDIVKRMSRPALFGSLIVSAMIVTGFYYIDPQLEKTREFMKQTVEDIEVVEIPPTAQETQQAAPARPQVPIEAEDEADIEELTIEDTDLYEQAQVAVPEKLIESAETFVEEEPPMEFWMVEEKPQLAGSAVYPEYPDIARTAGMEGDVFVEMVVGVDGKVESVRVLRGPPIFHESAKAAAMKMEFTPARQNDRPVRVKVAQRISFRLR